MCDHYKEHMAFPARVVSFGHDRSLCTFCDHNILPWNRAVQGYTLYRHRLLGKNRTFFGAPIHCTCNNPLCSILLISVRAISFLVKNTFFSRRRHSLRSVSKESQNQSFKTSLRDHNRYFRHKQEKLRIFRKQEQINILSVFCFSKTAAILPFYTNRMGSLLNKSGVINRQHTAFCTELL